MYVEISKRFLGDLVVEDDDEEDDNDAPLPLFLHDAKEDGAADAKFCLEAVDGALALYS